MTSSVTVRPYARRGAVLRWLADVATEDGEGCRPFPNRPDAKGYGVVRINGVLRKASHVVLELAGRPQEPGTTMALHSCDNPPCCAPWHLRWGTAADNGREAYERGQKACTTRRGARGRFTR